MAEFDRQFARSGSSAAEIDQGLRAYMLKVYNYMTMGVGLTGVVAYLVSQNPTMMAALFGAGVEGGTPILGYVVMFAPLAFVLVLSFGIQRLSVGASQMLFWVFAAVMGLSLSTIMLVYTGQSIARTFFVTTMMFGSLSVFGYMTKKDLSGMGTFLFMGLIGLILASVVNMFMASTALDFAISVIGVLIFAGLTAYDTQKIKNMYFEVGGHGEVAEKTAIMGALALYLDFVNMFLFLLRFLGNRE